MIACRALAAWVALSASAPCGAAALQVEDDRGRAVTLAGPARRIVTLAPHLTEIVFAAGAGDRLAGVSAASEFPEAAKALPVAASHGRADAERIAWLRPDLVLAWLSGTPVREVLRLERLGVPLVVTEVRTLDDIARLVLMIGRLAGTERQAEKEAARLRAGIEALSAGRDAGERTRVFIEVWHRPLMTVNGAHLMSDVVRRCGGRNVFDRAQSLAFVVSREQLLQAQPQAILMNASADEESGARERWTDPLLPAVRRGRLHAVDPKRMHSLGPGVLAAARAVCAALVSPR